MVKCCASCCVPFAQSVLQYYSESPSLPGGLKGLHNTINVADLPDKARIEAFKVFVAFDENRDGCIDPQEFSVLMKQMMPKVRHSEINRIYSIIDKNKSGIITFDEFLVGVGMLHWDLKNVERASSFSTKYEWEIPFRELSMSSKLGEGTFGVVYKATWRGTLVAAKKLKGGLKNVEDFRREIAILGKLRHPSVVLFMGASTEGTPNAIVTEFMKGGSVYDNLQKKRDFSPAQLKQIAVHVIQGLNYLHLCRPKIVHRDLKPHNILLDENMQAKLADFGLSTAKQDAFSLQDRVGTPVYMAPELLQSQAYTEKVDIYSFGVCLWQLYTGQTPFEKTKSLDDLSRLVIGGSRPEIPPSIPPAIAAIIRQCWQPNPQQRPSADKIAAMLQRA